MNKLKTLQSIIKEFKNYNLNEDQIGEILKIFESHINLIYSLNPRANNKNMIKACLDSMKASIISSINLARIDED